MRVRGALSILVAALVSSACGNLFDPAAAVVRGDKITVGEIQEVVDDFKRSPEFERLALQGDADALTREFEQSYLSQLIRRAVFQPQARELEIEVADDEVEAQLEQIKADFPSQGAFEEALKEQGLTLDQLEELIADRTLEEKLRAEVTVDVGPSEEEIAEHYEANVDDFRETQAQHILVEDRALARRLSDQLQAAPSGEVEDLFARLARRHSTDESNNELGGALGYFSPGDFVPEFEEAAAELRLDEISKPVRSQFGWHVIRVTDRRVAPLDEVREQISVQLGGASEDEAWEQWVQEAYEAADVRVNPRYGEFNPVTQQIEDASPRTVPGAEETSAASPEPVPTP